MDFTYDNNEPLLWEGMRKFEDEKPIIEGIERPNDATGVASVGTFI